jgi:dTDP-glucose pyrophosphorylase
VNNCLAHLITSGSNIKEALAQLNLLAEDAILFVVDERNKLIGSLTDGDVRRGLIKGVSIDEPVNQILRANPKFIRRGDCDFEKVIEYREGMVRILPILDKNDRVVDVINFRKSRSYLPIDAVIMAGGKGQRLAPLTNSIPKPLLKIGNKPIIEQNIERLSYFGIRDYWITICHLGEQIVEYLGNGKNHDININYIWEKQPLGTIGGITKIQNLQHEYILVTNSDILTNLDYESFFIEFINQDADLAVVTIPYQVNVPYAVLEIDKGNVLNLKEKPTFTYYSNGGIYLMKREVIENIPADTHFNATDLMEKLIAADKKVLSFPSVGYWLDIGSLADFEKAQNDIKNIRF